MTELKRFFLSRTTILTLIVLTTALITLAALVPQSFMTSPADMGKWRGEHQLLSRITNTLGLHRAYSHPFFASVLAVVAISLLLSTIEQFRISRRRVLGPREAFTGERTIEMPAGREACAGILRSEGYLPIGRGNDVRLFIRHPWGHWGNVLFHLGMAVAVASSLLVAVTQQRGLLHMIEGEIYAPPVHWFAEENGIAADRLTLPFAVRLDRLAYTFRENYGVRSIASTLTVMPEGQAPFIAAVKINDILHLKGLRIYQGIEFGHAFYLTIEDRSGDKTVLPLLMPHPRAPGEAGYNDFREILPFGYLLRAKYFVDAERRSFLHVDPLLVLRLDRNGAELGQVRLREGERGTIGTYDFRILGVRPWTRLYFMNVTGIGGVFAGFFIIVLGSVLYYFTPPREAVLLDLDNGGTRMAWRATRFAGFYGDEYERLIEALSKGAGRG